MHLGFPLAAKGITSGYRAELVWGESLRTGHWGGRRVLEKEEDVGMPCPRLPEEGDAACSPL